MNTDKRTAIKQRIYGMKDDNGNFQGGMIRQKKNDKGKFEHKGKYCKANFPNQNREERKMMAKREAMRKEGIIDD
mgnify:CR=1 FL=1